MDLSNSINIIDIKKDVSLLLNKMETYIEEEKERGKIFAQRMSINENQTTITDVRKEILDENNLETQDANTEFDPLNLILTLIAKKDKELDFVNKSFDIGKKMEEVLNKVQNPIDLSE